jgi:DNA-binding transcriptional MerR regulator/methylmalonyl-CoA mutase cobalamin-binding subunit
MWTWDMQNGSLYTLTEVVRLIGIPKQTLHAWERRHRVVVPTRSQSNRRLYSQDDVYRLHILGQLVDTGERIGAIADLSLEDLEARLRKNNKSDGFSVEDFIRIIQELDQKKLDQKLTEHFLARGPINFAQEVIFPTLSEIGRRWADGDIMVSSEHLFTASARSLLGLALNQGPAQTEEVTALFTTPAGEPHELGILAAAVAAKNRGIRTVYLGPQLPPDEVLLAADKINADIVCLGCLTLASNLLSNQINQILRGLPTDAEIWLGGAIALDSEIVPHPRCHTFDNLETFENALRIKTLLTIS